MSGVEIDVQSNASVTNRELLQINENLLRIAAYAKQTTDALNSAFRTGQFSTTSRSVDKVTASMKNLDTTSNNAFKGMDKGANRAEKSISSLTSGIGVLLKSAAALGAISFGLKASDELSAIDSKLRTVTDTMREFQVAQSGVRKAARETNTTLASTADTYRSLARAMQGSGASQADILGLTKTLNQAAIVSGEAAESINAARIQLMQGLSSGVLRGEEFNSVTEQWSRLSQSIAKYAGVTVGQLRVMANDGKLTSQMVVAAVKADANAIAAEYEKVSLRLDTAFSRFSESLKQLVGKLASRSGLSAAIADVFITLANGMSAVSDGSGEALRKVSDRFYVFFRDIKKHVTGFADIQKLLGGGSSRGAFLQQFLSVHEMKEVLSQFSAFAGKFQAVARRLKSTVMPEFKFKLNTNTLTKFVFDISRILVFTASAIGNFAAYVGYAFRDMYGRFSQYALGLKIWFKESNTVWWQQVRTVRNWKDSMLRVFDEIIGYKHVTEGALTRSFRGVFQSRDLDSLAGSLRHLSYLMRNIRLGSIGETTFSARWWARTIAEPAVLAYRAVTGTSDKARDVILLNWSALSRAAHVLGAAVKGFYTDLVKPAYFSALLKVQGPLIYMFTKLSQLIAKFTAYGLSEVFELGEGIGANLVQGVKHALSWMRKEFAHKLTIPVAVDFAEASIMNTVKLLAEGLSLIVGAFKGALSEAIRPTDGWFASMRHGFSDMLGSMSDSVGRLLTAMHLKSPKSLFTGMFDGLKDLLTGVKTPMETLKNLLSFRVDYKAGVDFSALYKSLSNASRHVRYYLNKMWDAFDDTSVSAKIKRSLGSVFSLFSGFTDGLRIKLGKFDLKFLSPSQAMAESLGRFFVKAIVQFGVVVVNSVKSLVDLVSGSAYTGFAHAFDLIFHFLRGAIVQAAVEMSRGVVAVINALPDSAKSAMSSVKSRLKSFILVDDLMPRGLSLSLNTELGGLFTDAVDSVKAGLARVNKALHGDSSSIHLVAYNFKVTAVAVKDSVVKALKVAGVGMKNFTLPIAMKLNLSNDVQSKIKGMFATIADGAAAIGEGLQEAFKKAYELFLALIAGISAEADKFQEIYSSKIHPFIRNVIDGFYLAWDEVVGHCSWPDLVKGVDKWADKFSGISDKVKSFTSSIVGMFSKSLEAVRGYLAKRFDIMVNMDPAGFKNFFISMKDNMLAALVSGVWAWAGLPWAGALKAATVFGFLQGPVVNMGASMMVQLASVVGKGTEKLASNLAYMFKILLATSLSVLPGTLVSFFDGLFGLGGMLSATFNKFGHSAGILLGTAIAAGLGAYKFKFLSNLFGGVFGPFKAVAAIMAPKWTKVAHGVVTSDKAKAGASVAKDFVAKQVKDKPSAILSVASLATALLPGISWKAAGAAAIPYFMQGFKIADPIADIFGHIKRFAVRNMEEAFIKAKAFARDKLGLSRELDTNKYVDTLAWGAGSARARKIAADKAAGKDTLGDAWALLRSIPGNISRWADGNESIKGIFTHANSDEVIMRPDLPLQRIRTNTSSEFGAKSKFNTAVNGAKSLDKMVDVLQMDGTLRQVSEYNAAMKVATMRAKTLSGPVLPRVTASAFNYANGLPSGAKTNYGGTGAFGGNGLSGHGYNGKYFARGLGATVGNNAIAPRAVGIADVPQFSRTGAFDRLRDHFFPEDLRQEMAIGWSKITTGIKTMWSATMTFVLESLAMLRPKIAALMATMTNMLGKYKYALLGIGLLVFASIASAADNTGAAFARQTAEVSSSAAAISGNTDALLKWLEVSALVGGAAAIGGFGWGVYKKSKANQEASAPHDRRGNRLDGPPMPSNLFEIGANAASNWRSGWSTTKEGLADIWSSSNRAKLKASWGKFVEAGASAMKTLGRTVGKGISEVVSLITGGLLSGPIALIAAGVATAGLVGLYLFGPEGTFMEKLEYFKDKVLESVGFLDKVWDPKRKQILEAAPLKSFDGKDTDLSKVVGTKDPSKMRPEEFDATVRDLSRIDSQLAELEHKRKINGALDADEQRQADGLVSERQRVVGKMPNKGIDASALFGSDMQQHFEDLQKSPWDRAKDAFHGYLDPRWGDDPAIMWSRPIDTVYNSAARLWHSTAAVGAGAIAAAQQVPAYMHRDTTKRLINQWSGIRDSYDQGDYENYLSPEEQTKYQSLIGAYADRLDAYSGGYRESKEKVEDKARTPAQRRMKWLSDSVLNSVITSTAGSHTADLLTGNVQPRSSDMYVGDNAKLAKLYGDQLQAYIQERKPTVEYRKKLDYFGEREAVDKKTAADVGADYSSMSKDQLDKLIGVAAQQRFLRSFNDGNVNGFNNIGDKAANKFQKQAATIKTEANEAYAKGIQEAAEASKHWKTDIDFAVKVGGLDVATEDMNNFYAQSNKQFQDLKSAAEAYNKAVIQRDNLSKPGSWKKDANGDFVEVTQAEFDKQAKAAQANVDSAKKQMDALAKGINPLASLQKDMQTNGVTGEFQASFGVETFNRVRGLVSYITQLRQDISRIATGSGAWSDKMSRIAVLSAQAAAATQAINEALYQHSTTTTQVQQSANVDTTGYMSQDKGTRGTIEALSRRLHEIQLKEQAFQQQPGTALGEPYGVKTTTPDGVDVVPMARPSEEEFSRLMKERLAIQERIGEISKTFSNPLDKQFSDISMSGLSVQQAQYNEMPADMQKQVRQLSVGLNEQRLHAKASGRLSDARDYADALTSANALVDDFVKRLATGIDPIVARINEAGGTSMTAQQYMSLSPSVRSDLVGYANTQADALRNANLSSTPAEGKIENYNRAIEFSDKIKGVNELFATIEEKLSAFSEAIPDVDVNELKKGPQDQYDLALRIGANVRSLHRTTDKIVDPKARETALQAGLDSSKNVWNTENSRPDKLLRGSGISLDNETLVKYFSDRNVKATLDPALQQLAALKVQAATDPVAAAVYNLAVDKFTEAMKKAQESDPGLKMKAAGESFATDVCSAINEGVLGVFSGKKVQDIWKSLKDTFVSSVNKTVIGGFMDGITGPDGIITKQLKTLGAGLWKDGNDAAKKVGIDTPQVIFKNAVTEFGAWVQKLAMSAGLPGSGATAATGLTDPYSLTNGTYTGTGLQGKTVLGMTTDNPFSGVSIPGDSKSWANMTDSTDASMYSLGKTIPNIDNIGSGASNYLLGTNLKSSVSSTFSPYTSSSLASTTDAADVSKIGFSDVTSGLSTNADTITANASTNTTALSSVFNSGWLGLGAKMAMMFGASSGNSDAMWIGLGLQALSIYAGAKAPAPAAGATTATAVAAHADGGWISGAGTGTSDSIMSRLSNGEFVVKAKQALKFRPLLEAINGGSMPAFANGGLVGMDQPALVSGRALPAVTSTAIGGSTQIFHLNITGDVSRQTRNEIQAMIPNIAQGVNVYNHEKGNR